MGGGGVPFQSGDKLSVMQIHSLSLLFIIFCLVRVGRTREETRGLSCREPLFDSGASMTKNIRGW